MGGEVMRSFQSWLSSQRKRDDPVGDVARDFRMARKIGDPYGAAIGGIRNDAFSIANALDKVPSCANFQDALFDAYMEWSGRDRSGRMSHRWALEEWYYSRLNRLDLARKLRRDIQRPSRGRSGRGVNLRLRFEVLSACRFRCVYCGVLAGDVVLVVDHVKAWARGGVTEHQNLVAACVPCNAGKGASQLSDEAVRSVAERVGAKTSKENRT